jgi:hypothetical protein
MTLIHISNAIIRREIKIAELLINEGISIIRSHGSINTKKAPIK